MINHIYTDIQRDLGDYVYDCDKQNLLFRGEFEGKRNQQLNPDCKQNSDYQENNFFRREIARNRGNCAVLPRGNIDCEIRIKRVSLVNGRHEELAAVGKIEQNLEIFRRVIAMSENAVFVYFLRRTLIH